MHGSAVWLLLFGQSTLYLQDHASEEYYVYVIMLFCTKPVPVSKSNQKRMYNLAERIGISKGANHTDFHLHLNSSINIYSSS